MHLAVAPRHNLFKIKDKLTFESNMKLNLRNDTNKHIVIGKTNHYLD